MFVRDKRYSLLEPSISYAKKLKVWVKQCRDSPPSFYSYKMVNSFVILYVNAGVLIKLTPISLSPAETTALTYNVR
jgi:hypothetical protein